MDYKPYVPVDESRILYLNLRRLDSIIGTSSKKNYVKDVFSFHNGIKVELTAFGNRLYAKACSPDYNITHYFFKELMPGLSLEKAVFNARQSLISKLTSLEKDKRSKESEKGLEICKRDERLKAFTQGLKNKRESSYQVVEAGNQEQNTVSLQEVIDRFGLAI